MRIHCVRGRLIHLFSWVFKEMNLEWLNHLKLSGTFVGFWQLCITRIIISSWLLSLIIIVIVIVMIVGWTWSMRADNLTGARVWCPGDQCLRDMGDISTESSLWHFACNANSLVICTTFFFFFFCSLRNIKVKMLCGRPCFIFCRNIPTLSHYVTILLS